MKFFLNEVHRDVDLSTFASHGKWTTSRKCIFQVLNTKMTKLLLLVILKCLF